MPALDPITELAPPSRPPPDPIVSPAPPVPREHVDDAARDEHPGRAVLAAAGIVLYFTAPGDVTAAPVATPDHVGLPVLGRF